MQSLSTNKCNGDTETQGTLSIGDGAFASVYSSPMQCGGCLGIVPADVGLCSPVAVGSRNLSSLSR